MKTINIAILGASGYTGVELLRILYNHPAANVIALTGDSQAGNEIAQTYPHLAGYYNHKLLKHEEVDFVSIDLVFCCLPHATTQQIIAALPAHLKIIDLSADFRLHNIDEYKEWYGHEHQAVALQKEAVYGLVEHNRAAIKKARLIANPGCYPTSVLLPLLPIIKDIDADSIVINSMSGVTGAGRKVQQSTLFCEVNESVKAYSVGAHRHMAEMEQELSAAAGKKITVSFTPHLVPIN